MVFAMGFFCGGVDGFLIFLFAGWLGLWWFNR